MSEYWNGSCSTGCNPPATAGRTRQSGQDGMDKDLSSTRAAQKSLRFLIGLAYIDPHIESWSHRENFAHSPPKIFSRPKLSERNCRVISWCCR